MPQASSQFASFLRLGWTLGVPAPGALCGSPRYQRLTGAGSCVVVQVIGRDSPLEEQGHAAEPVVVGKGEPWPYKPGYVAAQETVFYPATRGGHGLQVDSVARWWSTLTVEERATELGR